MPSSTSSDRGQATVELALAMPLVALMTLAVVQVAILAGDRLAVEFAARDAARAASVAAGPDEAASAAARSTALRPLRVSADVGEGSITVVVAYTDPTDMPIIGALLPDITVSASSTMPFEPP